MKSKSKLQAESLEEFLSQRIAVFAGSLVLILPFLALIILRVTPNGAELEKIIQETILPIASFRPEPGERVAFMLALVGLPLLILAGEQACTRWRLRSFGAHVLLLAAPALSIVLAPQAYGDLLSATSVATTPVSAIIGGVLLCAMAYQTSGKAEETGFVRALSWMASMAAIFLVILSQILNLHDPALEFDHLHAVLYAITQTVAGSTLGVDFPHQYGFYPAFLTPVFRVIGLNLFNYSLIMATLSGVGLWFLYSVFSKSVRNPVIASLGFLAVICTSFFLPTLIEELKHSSRFPDPYFQYHPVRWIFPTLMLYLARRYTQQPSRRLSWIITSICGLACLWNLDSGIPVAGAWILILAALEVGPSIPWRKWLLASARHALTVMLSLAAAVLLYALFARVFSGSWPNLQWPLHYQRYFYGSGYMMLPMPVFHPWNCVALIELGGIAYALNILSRVRQGAEKNVQKLQADAAFFLGTGVLGLGLFSYYQGRSHDFNLFAVGYPAILLLTCFSDRVLQVIRRGGFQNHRVLTVFLGMCIFLFANFSLTLITETSEIRHWISSRSGVLADQHQEEEELLARHTSAGEEVLILSDYSALFHLAAGTRAPVFQSFVEMPLLSQYQAILDRVSRGTIRKVFISESFPRGLSEEDRSQDLRRKIAEEVFRNYRLTDQSAEQRLLYFEHP